MENRKAPIKGQVLFLKRFFKIRKKTKTDKQPINLDLNKHRQVHPE